jgi:hypothetical protein
MAKPDFDPISEELHRRIEAFKLLRHLPDRRAVYVERAVDPMADISLCFRTEAALRRWLAEPAKRRMGGAV